MILLETLLPVLGDNVAASVTDLQKEIGAWRDELFRRHALDRLVFTDATDEHRLGFFGHFATVEAITAFEKIWILPTKKGGICDFV